MSEVKVADWISDAQAVLLNPSAVQRLSLRRLRDISDGTIDLPDSTSPFAFTLENSAINIAAFMEANEASTRKQYASVAQTVADLYLHMSDKNFVDRFASPAVGNFQILIEKNALDAALVLDQATGISSVTIPRNTEFHIEDHVFSIQHPIQIKKLSHSGYQVTYETSVLSPLEVLTTNIVEFDFVKPASNVTMLRLKVPAQQFWIKTSKTSISSAQTFRKNIDYVDNFYFARVFYKNNASNNKWVEMVTTHTDQVYDPTVPTASLKVLPNNLEVFIPQIYFTTGAVSGEVRIDVYVTKGEISMSMANYSPSSFTAMWKAIDDSDVNEEVAAFRNISEVLVISSDTINGGTNGLTFDELRRRVINNTMGTRDLPITNVQIEDSLSSNGFSIVRDVDVVTRRTFLATRELVKPFDERLITSAATSMQALVVTMQEISKHPSVFANGNRVTLTPDLIYRISNGQMEVVSAARVMAMINATPEESAAMVNSEQYVYSPFHYVLDATESQFRLRPYHLDAPVSDTRQFVDHNDSTLMEANTEVYSFTKMSFGYRLTVQVKGNENYNNLADSDLFAQLYFVPVGEVSKAYINGQLVNRTTDGGAVFVFDFTTSFDIDAAHSLFMTSFAMSNNLGIPVASALKQNFNMIFGTFNVPSVGWNHHNIDNNIGQFSLPENGFAITEELFTLQFGQHLQNMWAGCRSFPAPNQYKLYETDVPATHPEDVFEQDPVTKLIFKLDENNNVVYNYKHRKGDVVVNDKGEIEYAYKAGQIMRDTFGNPIPISESEVARQVELMVVEGSYYFATDPSSATYKTNFVSAMVDWIVDDIERLRQQVLEETFIYYYPKANMGSLRVIGENGSSTFMQASQSFKVRLFVSDQVMRNAELRDSLTRSTIRIIDAELQKSVIAISNIEAILRDEAGNDVLGIEVTGMGGAANYQAVSMISVGDRFSIRKRLTSQSDGKLIVEEDVTVEFIRHST